MKSELQEGRDLRPEASECVCVLKQKKEGARKGETKSHKLKEGGGQVFRDKRD